MAAAALVARLVLAGVFIAAGVGKLLDRRGSQRALREFGVPARLTGFGALALPVAELATAAALLVQPSAPWGAVAALVLLAGFTVGIVNALARGRAPDCHCFGTVHSAPAGPSQVVRNGVLAAVAAVVVIEGAGSSTSTLVPAKDGAAVIELLLAVLALSLLVASLDLWRQRRGLREELTTARRIASAIPPGLPVGALAPEFAARDTDGETFTLDDLRSRGRPVVLVFGAPGCGPCSTLAPDLRRWQETLADTVTVGLVGIGAYFRYEHATDVDGGSVHDIYARDPELAAESDELNAVLASYRLAATPSAVLVTPEGTIASATVDGRPAIKALIRLAVTGRGAPGMHVTRAHAAAMSRRHAAHE